MAYGSAKGRIFRGDIYAEDDPNQDTYIDWGNDFISFGVGGVKVLNVSASNTLVQVLGNVSASLNITASGHVSASAFYGDGQYLKNVGGGSGGGIFTTLATGNAYTTSSIRVGSAGEPSASLHVSGTGAGAGPVFRLDSSVAGGRPLFFVSGSGRIGIGTDSPARSLEIEDPASAAFQLTALNARGAGNNNSYSFISDYIGFSIFETSLGGTPAYRFCIADGGGQTTRGFVGIGNGAGMAGSTFPTAQLHVSASNGGPAFRVDGPAVEPGLFVTGSALGMRIGVGTTTPSASLHVSGNTALIFLAEGPAGSTLLVNDTSISSSANITASGHVSASAFYGDGQYLKNVGGAGTVSTTTGGGNNTLFLPFVSSSTGVGSATLFTAGALSLKPQSGSLTLAGDGQSGVSGSFLGAFTTTSSYGSRVALKGANVGSSTGTEPYIHPVSSSYTVPANAFGGGFPPGDLRLSYETLEIKAPSGQSDGGDMRLTGSGNLHVSFARPSGSGAWPFTKTFQSTMEFGSLETAVMLTSSLAGIINSPWSIINGSDSDGAMYGGIDYDSEGWYFDSGSNSNVTKFSSPLQGEWTGDFNFRSPGSASFFNGLIVHNVPLTSNVGAQIGGGSGNKLQVVVTSSFNNNTLFTGPWVSINNTLTSNSNQLFISGASGGGMAVNITSSDNNNSLYTGGGALLGHSGGGNADIRLFAGGSGQAGTISGSSNLQLGGSAQVKGNVIAEGNLNTTGGNISGSGALMIAGNADIAGNTTLGTGNDSLTIKVNSVKSNASDVTWLLRSGSVGTGSGPGKNGPLMFYITHSGGSTTDLLKFNTASGSVGVVFPTTFYPNQGNSVDIGSSQLAFRTLYAHQAAVGTHSPKTALDVHYTGSFSPTGLNNDTGGGAVVYFGTSSASGLQAGALYYLNANGGWASSSAGTTGSNPTGGGGHNQLLAISMGTNPSADGMLLKGYFDATSYYAGTFTKGGPVYVSTASAQFKAAAPTASNNYVRVIGYGTDTPNVIYFNPDSTYVEIA
jgi:hypothetical protein